MSSGLLTCVQLSIKYMQLSFKDFDNMKTCMAHIKKNINLLFQPDTYIK